MGAMQDCYISMDWIELIVVEIRMERIVEVISVSEYRVSKTFFILEEKIERKSIIMNLYHLDLVIG